jgi:hypothetical protein
MVQTDMKHGRGGVQVAKGLGDSVRGTTFAAIDTVEKRDSSVNDEIARRGRMEIEQGIAMIKGRPVDTAAIDAHKTTQTNSSLQGTCLFERRQARESDRVQAGDQASTVPTQTPRRIRQAFRLPRVPNTHRVCLDRAPISIFDKLLTSFCRLNRQ